MARPGGARPAQSSRPYRSRALLRVCRPSGLPDDDMMAPPGQAFIAGLQQTTEPGRPSSPSHRPARPSTVSALPASSCPWLARAGEVADSVTPATVPVWCGCGMPNKCALSSDKRNQPATARTDRAAQNTRRTSARSRRPEMPVRSRYVGRLKSIETFHFSCPPKVRPQSSCLHRRVPYVRRVM